MGPSGAGKTSLLRAAAALLPFDGGTVKVGATTLRPGPLRPEASLRELRRALGFVFQSHALFEHLTALENLTLAPVHAHGMERAEAERRSRALLESLGVGHRADARPRELSGGEAQRVAIARTLVLEPLFLLLDEPTAALDHGLRAGLGATLRTLASTGCGVLLATHDADFARQFADRILTLENGEVAPGPRV
jgi:ABC-type polar amino acid transport system ATPase subunit